MADYPTVDEIAEARARLGDLVIETPAHQWRGPEIEAVTAPGTQVFLKLELFQYTGTFKPRGALTNLMSLSEEQLRKGVTAFSAGNHAVATAYAAKVMGSSAKVVMTKAASKIRLEKSRGYGAEVILTETIHEAFDVATRIQEEEGRFFVPPYDGPFTTLGTATAGWEFARQVQGLDAMIIPIGGGGLCAGFSCALKQMQPQVRIIGVEPVGAQTMSMSFAQGSAAKIDKIETIADSLAPPCALEYSYKMCRAYVEEIVLITDDEMRRAMRLIFEGMKLAVEPAGAAAIAALTGPLKEPLAGQKVGVLVCGTNIDMIDFCKLI
jgi:threonine dehydratase